MTFDEALKEVSELSKKGADTWYGDQLEKRTNVKGHLESGDVEVIINKIRKEYAPTVEMNKHQKFVFMRLHENKKPVFVDIDTIYNTPEFASIDTDLLILAWFHPEIIKVVEEK